MPRKKNNNPNIALVADTHLGQYWRSNPNRAQKLIMNFKKNLERISEHASTLFILGDFYHSVSLPPDCMFFIDDMIFRTLEEKFDDVRIVVGNHEVFLDIHGLQKSIPSIHKPKNCTVYENGVDLMKGLSDDIEFYTLPFQRNLDLQIEYMSKLEKTDKRKIVLSHFTPTEIFERSTLSLKPIIENLNVDKIFLGDYHEPKQTSINSTEIYSIGSSYFWDITDIKKEEQKRFLVLNTKDMTVNSYDLILPEIVRLTIGEENELSTVFDSVDKEKIYYIESKIPLDLTQYISNGYDIYYNYISDNHFKVSMNGVNFDESDFVDVSEMWGRYIEVQKCDKEIKDIANKIFNIRNSLTTTDMYNLISESGEENIL